MLAGDSRYFIYSLPLATYFFSFFFLFLLRISYASKNIFYFGPAEGGDGDQCLSKLTSSSDTQEKERHLPSPPS